MNYQKIYDDICKRGQERQLPKEVYTEKHHIVPKCLGGGNEKSNLTVLTAREHFLVHYILTRIYPNNSKIWNACFKMCTGGESQTRFIPDSKLYEFIKIELNKLKKGQTYEQLYGQERADEIKQKISKKLTGKIVSKITRQNMSIARTGVSLGSIHSEEQKQKWSIERTGERSPCYGRKLSEDEIRRRTENRDYTVSEETKELLRLRSRQFFESETGKECIERYKIKFSGENNPFYGKSHTFKSLQQMMKNNPNRKPCIIDEIEYLSANDASRKLNIPKHTIRRRLNSTKEEWKNWFFINAINK